MGKFPRRQRITRCLRFAPSVLTQIAPPHSATSQTPKALTGAVVDQAALYGLVAKIRDIGLPLLSVKRVEMDE